MRSGLPFIALGPDNKPRSILVDATGRIVTDLAPKPAITFPISKLSPITDADGNLRIVT